MFVCYLDEVQVKMYEGRFKRLFLYFYRIIKNIKRITELTEWALSNQLMRSVVQIQILVGIPVRKTLKLVLYLNSSKLINQQKEKSFEFQRKILYHKLILVYNFTAYWEKAIQKTVTK